MEPANGSSATQLRLLSDVHHAITSCERCDRLREYCTRVAREKKRAYRDEVYWGRPVAGFGDPGARVLIVGLAPAAHGANRTGRVFTGDGAGGSGDFLMSVLAENGFANRTTSRARDDGLRLRDAYIAAAVRCAPPDNKPTPEEIARCLDHLEAEVACLPSVRVVVALGRIAFDAWVQLLKRKGVVPRPRPQFGHGVTASFEGGLPALVGSFHPSRQNTNTGRLTPSMLSGVFATARQLAALPA
jgi:uracil-DNA glycosylase family 4